jgi:vacuolar-type H+-ATPase subunit E/Vma4
LSKGGNGVTGSLDILKQAEREARQTVEDARRKASSIRAAIPGEIAALGEELNRRVAVETRKREEAVRSSVDAGKSVLLRASEERIERLRSMEEELTARALKTLSELLSVREG